MGQAGPEVPTARLPPDWIWIRNHRREDWKVVEEIEDYYQLTPNNGTTFANKEERTLYTPTCVIHMESRDPNISTDFTVTDWGLYYQHAHNMSIT